MLAAPLLASASAGADDGYQGGTKTVFKKRFVHTPNSQNRHLGNNLYFDHDNYTVPGGIVLRWVRCGLDNSAPVGPGSAGAYQTRGYQNTGGTLGTKFKRTACAKTYLRARQSIGRGKSFGYAQYFARRPLP